MRKWAVITLVSIALAGAFAWLANRGPRSVEELKKDYAAACSGDVWTERLQWKWGRLTGTRVDRKATLKRRLKRVERYERSLINAGYLDERMFVVSNVPPRSVIDTLIDERGTWGTKENIGTWPAINDVLFAEKEDRVKVRFRSEGTNVVVVVAPRKDMARWEKRVRWAEAR